MNRVNSLKNSLGLVIEAEEESSVEKEDEAWKWGWTETWGCLYRMNGFKGPFARLRASKRGNNGSIRSLSIGIDQIQMGFAEDENKSKRGNKSKKKEKK